MREQSADFEAIPARYPELAGQVAVVTGSTRDVGRGIALRLAREGMRLVVNSRTPAAVETTTEELSSLGADVLPVVADIGVREDVDRLFSEALAHFGRIDLLVNNAADLRRKRTLDGAEALLEEQLATNIRGPFLCSVRAAEAMRASGSGGSIVNISTVGAFRAHFQGLPYDATKGAVDTMTRAMAIDLAEYGIRVNAVAPGAVRDARLPEGNPGYAQAVRERVPMGHFGLYLDVGAAVAFLASPDAAYVTGHVLYVDGGLTAQLTPRNAQI
jgi:3-oxoacyl-[acyl-carrier protein] reductase